MRTVALVPLLIALLALLAQSLSAATATQQGLISEFRAAPEAGRDVAASDILCRITLYGVECGRDDPYRDYYRDARALWHRRYSEVFLPPTNADSLARKGWQEEMPWSDGWRALPSSYCTHPPGAEPECVRPAGTACVRRLGLQVPRLHSYRR